MAVHRKQNTMNDPKRVFQEVSQNITQKQMQQSQQQLQQQNLKKTVNGNKQLNIKYFFKTKNMKDEQNQNQNEQFNKTSICQNREPIKMDFSRNRLDESLDGMFVKTNQNQTENECFVKPYINDILEHMKSIEDDYIGQVERFGEVQEKVDLKMRVILVDWLVQVHTEFNLLPQTLFMTINLVDRFICRQKIEMNQFQLLGVTALFMASKYEEIYPPELINYSIVTNNSFSV